jgi:hypothetical protein
MRRYWVGWSDLELKINPQVSFGLKKQISAKFKTK